MDVILELIYLKKMLNVLNQNVIISKAIIAFNETSKRRKYTF